MNVQAGQHDLTLVGAGSTLRGYASYAVIVDHRRQDSIILEFLEF